MTNCINVIFICRKKILKISEREGVCTSLLLYIYKIYNYNTILISYIII